MSDILPPLLEKILFRPWISTLVYSFASLSAYLTKKFDYPANIPILMVDGALLSQQLVVDHSGSASRKIYYSRLGRLFLIGFRFWAHYPSSHGKGFLKMT